MSGLDTTRRRPRDVWTAGILLMFFGGLGVVLSLFLLSLLADEDDAGGLYAAMLFNLAVAAAQIGSGAFVLAGREWARITAIVVCALNAAGGVILLASGGALQACVGIVANIALIVALNKQDVKDWCRR